MTLLEQLEAYLDEVDGQTFDLQAFAQQSDHSLAEARELISETLGVSPIDEEGLVYPRLQVKTRMMMAGQTTPPDKDTVAGERGTALNLDGLVLREKACQACETRYWRPDEEEDASCARCGAPLTTPDTYKVYRWDDEHLDFKEEVR